LIVEVDDPSGEKSIKEYLAASPAFRETDDWPIHIVTDCPHEFGQEFLDWLEGQIIKLDLKLVLLDSYTALRPSRPRGIDIVKVERAELALMDSLAKSHNCTFLVIHHPSKGASGLDWSDSAAGTFAIGAAAEGQIHISRFKDLSVTAPERLVRARGRHYSGFEGVLRFRPETLDYELVMQGAASSLFGELVMLYSTFHGGSFTPNMMTLEMGLPRATAHRHIARLLEAGAIKKTGYGKYRIAETVRKQIGGAR
jgi:hypothetical protein